MGSELDIAGLVQDSSQRETFIAVMVGVAATIWIIKQMIPLFQWMKGQERSDDKFMCREATKVILQKDLDGNNVFLSMPRMLREFRDIMHIFSEDMKGVFGEMKNLGNHQSETLRRMDKTQHETLRIITKLNDSTERFQKDFRKD